MHRQSQRDCGRHLESLFGFYSGLQCGLGQPADSLCVCCRQSPYSGKSVVPRPVGASLTKSQVTIFISYLVGTFSLFPAVLIFTRPGLGREMGFLVLSMLAKVRRRFQVLVGDPV